MFSNKKKIIFTAILMMIVVFIGSCVLQSEMPGNDEAQESENKDDVSMYYPLAVGNKWEYEGEGMEFSSYNQEVLYSKDNKYQVMIDNGGTVSANIYILNDESLIHTYFEAEVYDERNVLEAEGNMNDVIIKEPLEKGNTWVVNGNIYEITDVDSVVNVPAGTFDGCIVVKKTYKESGSFTRYYYCKGVGLVKSEYIDGEFIVTSSLKSYIVN